MCPLLPCTTLEDTAVEGIFASYKSPLAKSVAGWSPTYTSGFAPVISFTRKPLLPLVFSPVLNINVFAGGLYAFALMSTQCFSVNNL